jgi:hypothetical protein
VEEHQLPERRACRLVGLSRDCYRHPPMVNAATQALSARIVEIAHERRRFGYRRIHDLLRPQFGGCQRRLNFPHFGRCKFPHPVLAGDQPGLDGYTSFGGRPGRRLLG